MTPKEKLFRDLVGPSGTIRPGDYVAATMCRQGVKEVHFGMVDFLGSPGDAPWLYVNANYDSTEGRIRVNSGRKVLHFGQFVGMERVLSHAALLERVSQPSVLTYHEACVMAITDYYVRKIWNTRTRRSIVCV